MHVCVTVSTTRPLVIHTHTKTPKPPAAAEAGTAAFPPHPKLGPALGPTKDLSPEESGSTPQLPPGRVHSKQPTGERWTSRGKRWCESQRNGAEAAAFQQSGPALSMGPQGWFGERLGALVEPLDFNFLIASTVWLQAPGTRRWPVSPRRHEAPRSTHRSGAQSTEQRPGSQE